MTTLDLVQSDLRSLRSHAAFGALAIAAVLGGIGYWAMVTPISGAVVAGGTFVVEGGSRLVQHPEGGVVADIRVDNDEAVRAGQVLVRLDGTSIAAGLAVVQSQLVQAHVARARLLAESAGEAQMSWPEALDALPDLAASQALYAAETRLFDLRRQTLANQNSQLDEQVSQLERQIEGLDAERRSNADELAIVDEETSRYQALVDQKLTDTARLTESRKAATRLNGELARIEAETARIGATIAERRLQGAQLVDDFQGQVLTALNEANQKIAELTQQEIAAKDRLARLVITAPIDGVVHESAVQTVGGVIGAGETLMRVVPQTEITRLDARVGPLDIDKLAMGQEARLKLPGFDPRTTPELVAHVSRISPDLSTDNATGAHFYLVRVELDPDQLARLPDGVRLIPGMPVEAFFTTTDRTVLAYLLSPVLSELSLVFRED